MSHQAHTVQLTLLTLNFLRFFSLIFNAIHSYLAFSFSASLIDTMKKMLLENPTVKIDVDHRIAIHNQNSAHRHNK